MDSTVTSLAPICMLVPFKGLSNCHEDLLLSLRRKWIHQANCGLYTFLWFIALLQVKLVGKKRLVLDLSCRQRDGSYWVVTDRWQRFSSLCLSEATLAELAGSCDEFLVHGVDVEGMQLGIDEQLVELLGKWSPIPVTYAGGARTLVSQLDLEWGRREVDDRRDQVCTAGGAGGGGVTRIAGVRPARLIRTSAYCYYNCACSAPLQDVLAPRMAFASWSWSTWIAYAVPLVQDAFACCVLLLLLHFMICHSNKCHRARTSSCHKEQRGGGEYG